MAALLFGDEDLGSDLGNEVSVRFELDEIPSCESGLTKRKRNKIIHQGYSEEERKDARREAIRQFFLSIPLDSEVESSGQSDIVQPTALQPPVIDTYSPQPQSNPLSNALQFNRGHDMSFSSESPRQSKRKKHATSLQQTKRLSLGIHPSVSALRAYSTEPDDMRVAFVYKGYPAIYYSLIPYCKPEKKFRSDQSSAGRVRTNSVSVQLDLDEIDLCDPTKEVSLAHLLEPIWTSSEMHVETDKQILTPPTRGGSTKKPPALLIHQSSLREVGHQTPTHDANSKLYIWQSFKDCHTPRYVMINYEPDCLDNSEYFKGRKVTTLNLTSYRVSFCKYARESEVKKEINDQFNEMFPYIKLTLSKLRSIKKDMISVGCECDLDHVAIAHALVYFEKLVLIGKVNKTTRKLIAGASLLLAAKFTCDWKRQTIKNLIEEIIEKFKFSQKELLSYEFPTLVALDFSLLTPVHQVKLHSDKISSSFND